MEIKGSLLPSVQYADRYPRRRKNSLSSWTTRTLYCDPRTAQQDDPTAGLCEGLTAQSTEE